MIAHSPGAYPGAYAGRQGVAVLAVLTRLLDKNNKKTNVTSFFIPCWPKPGRLSYTVTSYYYYELLYRLTRITIWYGRLKEVLKGV